jgi:tRNA(Ile2) C34 agmatinyltransferase TiaS
VTDTLFFETSIKAYQIFSELISDKYETEFIRSGKQKIILRELTMLKLEKYVEEINDKCIVCNKTLKSILILK